MRKFQTLLLLCLVAVFSVHAFVVPTPPPHQLRPTTITARNEQPRRWNFNEGQSPWGMKNNAEIWNGRVAQMAFVVVFLQEVVSGKGVIQGIQEGDPVNLAALGITAVVTVGLTGFLALQGSDDYVKKDLGERK